MGRSVLREMDSHHRVVNGGGRYKESRRGSAGGTDFLEEEASILSYV